MSRLHRGDVIFTHCAGWRGYGVVLEQAGELVSFRRETDAPDAKPSVVRRDAATYVPDVGRLEIPLGELWEKAQS